MSQDIVADALNQMMNICRARKTSLELERYSKLLLSILALAKLKGFVKEYKITDKSLKIELNNIHHIQSIKPRFTVRVDEIEKYVQRYLPAKNIGIIILSTSQGLMTHHTAREKNIGGSLIAYIY